MPNLGKAPIRDLFSYPEWKCRELEQGFKLKRIKSIKPSGGKKMFTLDLFDFFLIANLSASFEYPEKFLNFLNSPFFWTCLSAFLFQLNLVSGFQGHIRCLFFEVKPKSWKP